MRFTYRYERRDFVQACIVIMRNSVRRRLLWMILWLALVAFIVAWGAGDRAALALKLLATGKLPWDIYAMLFGILALIWFHAQVVGWLICAPIFKRNALANQIVVLELDEQGLHGGTDDVSTRIAWSAIKRVVETPSALVFVLSAREGMTLPRRAVPSEQDYAEVLELVRRHVPSNRQAAQ